MPLTLGQVAYEAYGEDRDWLGEDERRLPAWAELAPGLKRAWHEAAQAVQEALELTSWEKQKEGPDAPQRRQRAPRQRGAKTVGLPRGA